MSLIYLIMKDAGTDYEYLNLNLELKFNNQIISFSLYTIFTLGQHFLFCSSCNPSCPFEKVKVNHKNNWHIKTISMSYLFIIHLHVLVHHFYYNINYKPINQTYFDLWRLFRNWYTLLLIITAWSVRSIMLLINDESSLT